MAQTNGTLTNLAQTGIFDPLAVAAELARSFAGRADVADSQGRMPSEDIAELRTSGYLALNVPVEFGGQGLGMADSLAAHLILAQGSASTALVAAMQMQIFGNARDVGDWPEAIYARFCRKAAAGELFNSVASEPAMGSPSRGGRFHTRAVANPGASGWRITGHKTWVTGGDYLDNMLVRCTTELPGMDPFPAVFLVNKGMPGIRWEQTWRDSLSLRASESHDLHLEDVVVPSDHLIDRGKSQKRFHPNAWFPMTISTTYLGAAVAARNTVIRYALERVPTALGRPISTLPKIQRQIGEMDLALQAAQALLFQTARRWDAHPDDREAIYPEVVAAKHLAVETAATVTEKALRVAGGIAITHDLPLERYFRDVQAGSMQPPSGDTALELIGRNAIEDNATEGNTTEAIEN